MLRASELDRIFANMSEETKNSDNYWGEVLKVHRQYVEEAASELVEWIQQELNNPNRLEDAVHLSQYWDPKEDDYEKKSKIRIGYIDGGEYTQRIFDEETMRLVVEKLNTAGHRAKMYNPFYPNVCHSVIVTK